MGDIRVVGYSAAGLGVGAYLFYKGFGWFRMKRLIENVPTSKIRSIAMGLVEISGKVVPAEKRVLKSPLTGKDCVYYKYSIEEERGSGKNRHWVTLKFGFDSIPFFVQDSTGKVLVDSQHADIDIPPDFEFQSSWGKDPPQCVRSFLKSNSLSFETFLGINKNMRYHEYFITPDDKLYILGTAGDNPFVEDTTAQDNPEDIMIQKGKDAPYYISDKGEKDIVSKFKWKAIGGLFGGGALIVICLAIILIYFGVT